MHRPNLSGGKRRLYPFATPDRRSHYGQADRVGLERELVDEVAKTSLPPTTPTSSRVH